jgi:hypothetical protein
MKKTWVLWGILAVGSLAQAQMTVSPDGRLQSEQPGTLGLGSVPPAGVQQPGVQGSAVDPVTGLRSQSDIDRSASGFSCERGSVDAVTGRCVPDATGSGLSGDATGLGVTGGLNPNAQPGTAIPETLGGSQQAGQLGAPGTGPTDIGQQSSTLGTGSSATGGGFSGSPAAGAAGIPAPAPAR